MNKLLFDENVISNAIRESIQKLINEELGISQEVSNAVKNIVELIKGDKNTMREKIEDGIFVNNGKITTGIFGYEFEVVYKIFSYRDFNLYFQKSGYFLNAFNSWSSFERKTINIVSLSISGHIEENTFSDTLYHEIEHMYQTSISGKLLLTNNAQYQMALSIVNDKNASEWDRFLAQVVYYTRNEEHDAFVNGLYGQLIKSDAFNRFDDIIRQSDAYKIIGFLKSASKRMEHSINDKGFDESANKFHRPKRWFINQANIASEKIFKKIMKVKSKALNDFTKVNEGVMFNFKKLWK